MAAYIDLNPGRAGSVEDPKDYRFCGYEEAAAGVASVVNGLRRIWSAYNRPFSMAEALRAHRLLLPARSDLILRIGAFFVVTITSEGLTGFWVDFFDKEPR